MRIRYRPLGLLLAGLAIAGLSALSAVTPAHAQEQKSATTVRPEIGKPIQAALDLLKSKRGKDALVKVREAEAVPDKTAYETYLVGLVHGQAAAAAGDASAAAHAFETIAASPAAPAGERLQFLAVAAGQYYAAKDYGKAAELATRYFKGGGSDKSVRTVYVQALYLSNDFAHAAKELLVDVQAEEQAGTAPAEDQLQLLANAYLKQRDNAGYADTMEKLVRFHPKRDYWLAVVYSVSTRAGFAERLALDLARLKLATGTLRTAAEYLEAAQLSLQTGFPAEAKKIVDEGYTAGLLGKGADAERHKRLKDMATKNLAEDKKTLGQDDAQVAALKEGTALLNTGFNYVLFGRADKGLALMEQGMRKGGLKRVDDARLHLGYAYHLAGQNQKAIQTFKTVHGTDGTAALARLWVIHLARTA
jgi:hypothetical protein